MADDDDVEDRAAVLAWQSAWLRRRPPPSASAAILALGQLVDWSTLEGFAGYIALCRAAGGAIGKRQMIRGVEWLERKGALVKTTGGGDGNRNGYRLVSASAQGVTPDARRSVTPRVTRKAAQGVTEGVTVGVTEGVTPTRARDLVDQVEPVEQVEHALLRCAQESELADQEDADPPYEDQPPDDAPQAEKLAYWREALEADAEREIGRLVRLDDLIEALTLRRERADIGHWTATLELSRIEDGLLPSFVEELEAERAAQSGQQTSSEAGA